MIVSQERRTEMENFLNGASQEELISYFVQYIRLTDSYDELKNKDEDRIAELGKKYCLQLPAVPVQKAVRQLHDLLPARLAAMKENDG